MNTYNIPDNYVTYNYRYFLPYSPEWGTPEFCNKRLDELQVFCKEARIDAVQFFVNILPGTYYMPAHSAIEQEHWASWMYEIVAPRLRDMGISYQLNFQMILGATSYGLDMRDEYNWDFLVDQHGNEALGCACPLSPVFRQQMGEMLKLWASTEPDIMWIDDDLRMHNHGLGQHELDYYCYCDNHLDKFAKFAGKFYSRQDLVDETLRPGAPSPVRLQWMDFLGSTMTETAVWLREQVHSVSPNTRLAQMTSYPDVHSAEGRNWSEFLTALCGDFRPITRPACGIYTGTSVRIKDNTLSYRFMGQSIATLEQTFGAGVVEYGPELENTRFTTWCKSASNTEFLLVLGQLLGCPQITLSMNDLDGSAINDEPTTVPVLRDNKPRLQVLADLRLRNWHAEGVVLINDPESARKQEVGVNAKMQDMGSLERDWEDTLLQVGIPAKYSSPADAASSDDVVVLESYTAWCPSDDEMREMLAGSVLIDGGAANVLQKRGFGEYIGVSVLNAESYGIVAEKYLGNVLQGVEESRIPHRGTRWCDMQLNDATLTSQFIDSKNRYHVGSTIYENSLGGRVTIYASVGDLSPSGTFGSHARLRWLHGVLRWISRERFGVLPIIPQHGLTIVRSNGNETLIAFANLGTDVLHEIKFRVRLANSIENVSILSRCAEWKQLPCQCESTDIPDTYIICIPCKINVFEWLVVKLNGVHNPND